MAILTNRELEFLAGLNKSWSRLYRSELALLLTVKPGDTVGSCLPFAPAEEHSGRRRDDVSMEFRAALETPSLRATQSSCR